ncbi:MAG: winged helix-turn-helix transcriptional regulator [Nitrospinae bacterium]|nr:winged helix-turn-helix transcriptional regulator [Nitrospinota bacterium]
MREVELETLAEEMWAIVKDLFKFLQFRDRDAMTACGLSVAQCYTLDAIGTQGKLMLSELAQALYIGPSTASRTVEELVRKELVERTQDPVDRRAVRLALTPKGQALYEAIRQHLIQRQLAILQQLDPGSRRSVLTALRQLSQAFKDPSCCAIPFAWETHVPAPSAATITDTPPRTKRSPMRAPRRVPAAR